MASDAQLTPMMAQYRRIKSELPKDALLLFRLGDFYELFFEDAQTGAQLLNVALTGELARVPLAVGPSIDTVKGVTPWPKPSSHGICTLI